MLKINEQVPNFEISTDKGSFKLSSRVKWIKVTNELEKNSFKKFLKSIFYFFLYKHRSHLMWKFECIK